MAPPWRTGETMPRMAASIGVGRSSGRYCRQQGRFCASYQCHSVACLGRPGLELGDKIIMPQVAFREVFLPYWMMQNLLLSEGGQVELRSVSNRPPSGSFVRFQSHDDTFLGVAARQGPKALMEAALRQYSVLAKGVTILVQHEGDNFYLDVVDVRTNSNTISPDSTTVNHNSNATDAEVSAGGNPENGSSCSPIQRAGSSDDGDDSDGGGGSRKWRRVSAIGLLGDLDLEVEFCSSSDNILADPRATIAEPCSRSIENERNDGGTSRGRERREGGMTLVPSLPPDSEILRACGRKSSSKPDMNMSCRKGRLAAREVLLPLPEPAKAKKCDEVSTSKQEHRALGISPPAPPPVKGFSRHGMCRAFSGKGFALGGEVGAAAAATAAVVVATDLDRVAGSLGERYCTVDSYITMKANKNILDNNNSATSTEGRDGNSAETRTTKDCGMILGEGTALSAAPSAAVTPMQEKAARDAATLSQTVVDSRYDGGNIEVTCESCRKRIPTANYDLHQLRCSVFEAEVSNSRQRLVEPIAVTNQDPNEDACPSIIPWRRVASCVRRCVDPLDTSSPLIEDNIATCSDIDSLRKPYAGGDIDPCDENAGNEENQPQNKGEKEASSSSNPPGVALKTSSAPSPFSCTAAPFSSSHSSSSSSQFSCAFCGLAYRDFDAAGVHDEVCGARTERCDRCFGLVSRRNAESHQRPGGPCDAAIAAAVTVEDQISMTGISSASGTDAALTSAGGSAAMSGSDVEGDRHNYWYASSRRLRDGVGQVENLLAQAVQSSRQASADLCVARAWNEANKLIFSMQNGGLQAERQRRPNGAVGCLAPSALPESIRLSILEKGHENRLCLTANSLADDVPGCKGNHHPGQNIEDNSILEKIDSMLEGEEQLQRWTCPQCTLDNSPAALMCEACGLAASKRFGRESSTRKGQEKVGMSAQVGTTASPASGTSKTSNLLVTVSGNIVDTSTGTDTIVGAMVESRENHTNEARICCHPNETFGDGAVSTSSGTTSNTIKREILRVASIGHHTKTAIALGPVLIEEGVVVVEGRERSPPTAFTSEEISGELAIPSEHTQGPVLASSRDSIASCRLDSISPSLTSVVIGDPPTSVTFASDLRPSGARRRHAATTSTSSTAPSRNNGGLEFSRSSELLPVSAPLETTRRIQGRPPPVSPSSSKLRKSPPLPLALNGVRAPRSTLRGSLAHAKPTPPSSNAPVPFADLGHRNPAAYTGFASSIHGLPWPGNRQQQQQLQQRTLRRKVRTPTRNQLSSSPALKGRTSARGATGGGRRLGGVGRSRASSVLLLQQSGPAPPGLMCPRNGNNKDDWASDNHREQERQYDHITVLPAGVTSARRIGAPACDVDLFILGRSRREPSNLIDGSAPKNKISWGEGQVASDTAGRARRVWGKQEGRAWEAGPRDQTGVGIPVGVAPAKLRRRVSAARLAPLPHA